MIIAQSVADYCRGGEVCTADARSALERNGNRIVVLSSSTGERLSSPRSSRRRLS